MRLTLRELELFAAGQAERHKEEWRQRITIAHLTASLMRAKKIPELRRFLPAPKLSVAQRREAVWDMVHMLALPGEIQKGKSKKNG